MSGFGAGSDYRWNGNELTRASGHGVAFLGRMTHREREAARAIQRDRDLTAELDYMHTHPFCVSRNIQQLAPTVYDEDYQHTHPNFVPRSTQRPAPAVHDEDYQHTHPNFVSRNIQRPAPTVYDEDDIQSMHQQVLINTKQRVIRAVNDRLATISLEEIECLLTQLCDALDKTPEYEIEHNLNVACNRLYEEFYDPRDGSGISTNLWERLSFMLKHPTARHH